jgi:hypothetical protein
VGVEQLWRTLHATVALQAARRALRRDIYAMRFRALGLYAAFVFLTAAFFDGVSRFFPASARLSAQRLLVAAIIAFLPAALRRRLRFGVSVLAGADRSVSFLTAAHRRC